MGNLSSGKSALVHRYLTGTYVQEESPEGELEAGPLGPSPSRCLCGILKPFSPPSSYLKLWESQFSVLPGPGVFFLWLF